MKKILVMGCGAQGSTIAKRLDEEPSVEQIVCADYDRKAVEELEKALKKAKAVVVDATSVDSIVKAGEGCELIVNGLAPEFNMNVMDAALRVGAHYQDMASGPVSDIGFVDAVKRQFGRDQEFKDAGLACLTNTGSAPGIANVLTREAVDLLETCSRIDIFVYDAIWSNKFIPFWWSPETAFADMAAEPVVYKNGEFIRVKPFNNPQMTEFRGLGLRRMVDHEHEEPVTMGLMADRVLKGVKEVNFRYGGPGLELAEAFYKMGCSATITRVHRRQLHLCMKRELDVTESSTVIPWERGVTVEGHECTGEETDGRAHETWTSGPGVASSRDAPKHRFEIPAGG